MSDIKVTQGAVITIELPGLTAITIDTQRRIVAADGISGTATATEPLSPGWRVLDLRDGTYGDFHRLRPASECGGCSMGYARAGFEVVGVDIEPQPHYPSALRRAARRCLPARFRRASVERLPLLESHKGTRSKTAPGRGRRERGAQ